MFFSQDHAYYVRVLYQGEVGIQFSRSFFLYINNLGFEAGFRLRWCRSPGQSCIRSRDSPQDRVKIENWSHKRSLSLTES